MLDAQRPIRVLQALRWDAEVEEQFFHDGQRELPRVSYSADLGFDPEAKIRELDGILRDADRELGPADQLGGILRATADEYRETVRMLEARGRRAFYLASRRLYGSTKDTFPDGQTTVRDMGLVLYDLFTAVGGEPLGPAQPRDHTAEAAAVELSARLERFCGGAPIRAGRRLLLADAAAGSDYVKIRSGATFSRSDVDILEAHEGWVHVATSLNGQAQPVARWLAKGPPRTTAVQEGLAALVEIFTFRSTPRRAKKLNDRILAVDKAEDASFLDVFEWYSAPRATPSPSASRTPAVSSAAGSSAGAPPSPRTPATAAASSSTTPSCAPPSSATGPSSSPSSSSARSPTRTSPCSTPTSPTGSCGRPCSSRRSSTISTGWPSGCVTRASSRASGGTAIAEHYTRLLG